MDLYGYTRSAVQSGHALITPDTHVATRRSGWDGASTVVHISPQMGARFTHFTARLESAGVGAAPPPGIERFVYVLKGEIICDSKTVSSGGYVYQPAGSIMAMQAETASELVVFERPYLPRPDVAPPELMIGCEDQTEAEPFQGDPDAQLQTLLPESPSFDMAVNIFTYQPGATLPQVEIHVMEHGLIMLAGAGVYRLGDAWYPVTAGDIIWMAPYCPQWFVAMGKQPARYLYYKDVHREGV